MRSYFGRLTGSQTWLLHLLISHKKTVYYLKSMITECLCSAFVKSPVMMMQFSVHFLHISVSLPSPQTRLWARLRSTVYHPVSCNAAKVTGSIRTVLGSPSTADIMEPCRTRDSQCEDTLPGAASWGVKAPLGFLFSLLKFSALEAVQYQVLQWSSQLRIAGHQVLLQGWNDGRGVNPHVAGSVWVTRFASRRTISTHCRIQQRKRW